MSETVTIHAGELAYLDVRAKKLAKEKSYLQLVMRLMNKVCAASGLHDTIACMLQNILDVVGGTNIALFYWDNGTICYADIFGQKATLDRIEDELVQKALTTGKPVEFEHDFSDSRMNTPEFGKAYTWVYPLQVGHECIGALKMESLNIDMRELYELLPTFFNFTAHVLKNMLAEEALKRFNSELEQRVQERTAQLEEKNSELEKMNKIFVGRELRMVELKERVRELEASIPPAAVAGGSK